MVYGTFIRYLGTASFANPAHISPEMLLSMLSMVDMGQSLPSLGDIHKRSQLLPVEKTSSIGLNSWEQGGRSDTNTARARAAANATSSCTRALPRLRTHLSSFSSVLCSCSYDLNASNRCRTRNSTKSTAD